MVESYTTLKGFDSLSSADMQTAIESNLLSFFEWGFLNKGGFTNVTLSMQNIRGSNTSVLRKVHDPQYNDGQVWAAPRQNLVWETGLDSSQPISISGVYVNNSFKTPTASGFQHYVDYNTGRVIFDTAIPTSSAVKMEYSYKNILMTTDDIVPYMNSIQFRSNDLTVQDYNTPKSGDWSSLAQTVYQLPLVSIELSPRTNFTPLEIGGTGQITHTDVLFHVFGETDDIVRKIAWGIGLQKEKTIYMYDLDTVSSSGAFGLNYLGAKQDTGVTYPTLVEDYRNNKLFFSDSRIQGPNRIGSVYHSVVRMTADVITLL